MKFRKGLSSQWSHVTPKTVKRLERILVLVMIRVAELWNIQIFYVCLKIELDEFLKLFELK